MKKSYAGINIQFPISQLILSGDKSVETRTYPIPKHYIGEELLLIETPGKTGKFKARIVATIKFGESFKYESEQQFYKDKKRHRVTPDSLWAWNDEKGKWGWPVLEIRPISPYQHLTKRTGIKFTKGLMLKKLS